MAQSRCHQPDRQRQVAAQPGYLGNRGLCGLKAGAAGQADEQVGGLAGRQCAKADRRRLLQRGQPPAAGDQHQAARRPGQQRADLIAAHGVIQHHQHLLAGQVTAPGRRPCLQTRRDLLRRDPGRQQQGSKRLSRIDRLLPRRVPMQAEKDLPAGEAVSEPVGGVHGERGLADPGHPVHRMDADHPTRRRLGDAGGQQVQLPGTPGERGRVTRQRAQRHRRLHARHRGHSQQALQHHLTRPVHVIGQADPADRRCLLHYHLDRAIHGRIGHAVPHHLLEEPGRGDDRQHTRRAGQGRLQRARVQQPERQIDRRRGHPVLVVMDLPGMQRHTQPDPLRRRMRIVVRMQRTHQRGRQRFHQQTLRHLGRNQDENAIAAILATAIKP